MKTKILIAIVALSTLITAGSAFAVAYQWHTLTGVNIGDVEINEVTDFDGTLLAKIISVSFSGSQLKYLLDVLPSTIGDDGKPAPLKQLEIKGKTKKSIRLGCNPLSSDNPHEATTKGGPFCNLSIIEGTAPAF